MPHSESQALVVPNQIITRMPDIMFEFGDIINIKC